MITPQGTQSGQTPTIEVPAPAAAPTPAPPRPIAPPVITAQPGVDAPVVPNIPATVRLETGDRTGSGYGPAISVPNSPPTPSRAGLPARNWIDQTQAEADAKSAGCMECHSGVEPMHKSPFVVLGCTDCHGGNARRHLLVEDAHPKPTYPEFWKTSANPPVNVQIYNHENPEWIRFVNPGDLRVVEQGCGLCHMNSINHVSHNMMSHGAHLWGAALYNNGGFPLKTYIFGQSYGRDGAPLKINSFKKVTAEDTQKRGLVPFLDPAAALQHHATGQRLPRL